MAELTKTQAHEMADAARAARVEARVDVYDYAPKNPDGSYTGEVRQRYSVVCTLRDAAHGNTVVRDLRSPCDVASVIAEMRAETKARAKETRARIRAERETDKS